MPMSDETKEVIYAQKLLADDLAQLIAKGVDLVAENQRRTREDKVLMSPQEVREGMLAYWFDVLTPARGAE